MYCSSILQICTIFLCLSRANAGLWDLHLRHSKFRNWDSQYEFILREVATTQCSTQLRDYFHDNRTRCAAPCACVISCLSANISDELKTNMQSASVLLGLTPTLLSFLGPSTSEAAVLAMERPLLAFFIAFGGTSVVPVSGFSRLKTARLISSGTSSTTVLINNSLRSHRERRWLFWTISFLQYLLALMAALNMVLNSLLLDGQTVIAWRCSLAFMPLTWNLLCLAIHLYSSLSLYLRLPPSVRRQRPFHSWSRFAAQELRLCAQRDDPWVKELDKPGGSPITSDIMYWVVSLAVVGHLIIGSSILSSLLFISMNEAIKTVMRYAASAVVCRAVLLFELGSMRARHRDTQENDG